MAWSTLEHWQNRPLQMLTMINRLSKTSCMTMCSDQRAMRGQQAPLRALARSLPSAISQRQWVWGTGLGLCTLSWGRLTKGQAAILQQPNQRSRGFILGLVKYAAAEEHASQAGSKYYQQAPIMSGAAKAECIILQLMADIWGMLHATISCWIPWHCYTTWTGLKDIAACTALQQHLTQSDEPTRRPWHLKHFLAHGKTVTYWRL